MLKYNINQANVNPFFKTLNSSINLKPLENQGFYEK